MPELSWWQWALAAISAFSVGIAKTGVPGLGILSVPLFVLAVGDARQSAGWLLPLLVVADLFAVVYFRRHASAGALFSLVPWVAVGMGAGALCLSAPERIIRPLVGCIILAILILFLLRQRGVDLAAHGPVQSGLFGTAAGFSTMVANAAGPIMNIYLLSRKLPREEFVATGAWFFFFINLTKLPVYAAQGMISTRSLLAGAALLLPTVAGALLGRTVLRLMPERVFVQTVIVLALLSTVLMFLPR
jgi:uncharacterized membrane protein YfcA